MLVPLVEATRGGVVESLHQGALAVVDADGKVIASAGSPEFKTFVRSSAKPLQALPVIESGALEKYALAEEELAIMCASHMGSEAHVKVVASIQAKVGIREEELRCGAHPAFDRKVAEQLWREGKSPTPIRNNCSGKHSGMLALSHHRWGNDKAPDGKHYLDFENPIQKDILQVMSEVCDIPTANIGLGIDGCSAPNFYLPLHNAALGAARLGAAAELKVPHATGLKRAFEAMARNPLMVCGEGQFDTEFIKVGAGRWISKVGAEGYEFVALRPSAGKCAMRGLGIAVKVADGDFSGRAASLVVVEVLRQLGLVNEQDLLALKKYCTHPITNWQKLEVGELRPCFSLERA